MSADTAMHHPVRIQMERNLSRFDPHLIGDTKLKRASVAVITGLDNTRPAFVLTRRAARLRGHAGQWAFPGGRHEPGETALQAAIRETHEELNLPITFAHCLGRLDDYETRSGYTISVFVFWADISNAEPNADEVASIHRFDLSRLDRPGSPELVPGPDPERPIIRMHVGPPGTGLDIHAPTGAILHQFHEVAVNGRHTRVAHFDQPDWAK